LLFGLSDCRVFAFRPLRAFYPARTTVFITPSDHSWSEFPQGALRELTLMADYYLIGIRHSRSI